MKTKLYTTVSELEIFAPFVNRLAEISAKSTVKFLEDKDPSPMIHKLRLNVAHDCNYLVTMTHIAQDERTEYKRDCLRDEMTLNNREASNIRRDMKREQDERELERLNDRLAEIESENDMLQFEIKRISDYLTRIQPIISDTLSTNGYDLIDIAKRAILQALQRSANASIILSKIEIANISYKYAYNDDTRNESINNLMDNIKSIIVAKKAFKTKDGCKYYTLKGYADQCIRDYINKSRSGIVSKTNFLTVGYDEQGNEQYIQADALTTAGGITDIFRRDEFREFCENLNLTDSEKLLARLLMQGKTQQDISNRFGVSQQAIAKRIQKIRDKLNLNDIVKNMRRYHNK